MTVISIILPTWNNAEDTLNCILSVIRNTKNSFHFIWIDNGSDDENHRRIRNALLQTNHVFEHHMHPIGFARAVNRGLRLIEGQYCAILNNDIEVSQGWDEELIEAINKAPGIAGPICSSPIGWQSWRNHDWLKIPSKMVTEKEIACWLQKNWAGTVVQLPRAPIRTNFRNMLAFFCVMMSSDVVDAVGILDENFGWGYYEDDDYCWRARNLGYSISLCPGAFVVHKGQRTMKNIEIDLNNLKKINRQYFESKYGLSLQMDKGVPI